MKQFTERRITINSRIEWIDCAKGLGIVLVVLGHTWNIPGWLYNGIYAFHMPLFFLLSGVTSRFSTTISFRENIKKWIKSYIVPYFVLAGINLVLQCIWLIYLGEFSVLVLGKYICGILYCFANVTWMPNCSPIWFLPALFFSKLLVLSAFRLMRGRRLHTTVVIVFLGVVALLSAKLDCPRLPWNILPAMMGSVFLWAGYCLSENTEFMEKGRNKISLLTAVIAMLLMPWILNNTPGMNENNYGNGVLFAISGFGLSFVLIQIAFWAKNIRCISSFFGQGTMILMGFNYFARTFAIEAYYLIPVVRDYPIGPVACFGMTLGLLSIILFFHNYLKRYKSRRRMSSAVSNS